MHDQSLGAGCLPMQNVSVRSSPERRKQFAALPDKAPQVLAQDTIYLSSPAVVWPHRALESRRVFQDLLRRSVPKGERNYPRKPPLIEAMSVVIIGRFSLDAQIQNVKQSHV